MSYIVADRVKETTTVTGTGPATLAGALSGYRSFASQLSIGDTCAYVIVNSNASEWETGIGTYSAVNTLTRTTIHASTNANAAVVFTAGVKDVFMGPTANTVLSDVTSTDGSVTINQTGTISDLSVAVAPATLNVLVAVRNTTGATLVKGTVVYISGSTGQISTVTKAIADSDANSAQTLGMISADIDDNTNGYVTIIGLIDNVDTKGYSAGTQLYLSPTVAGEFTSTKPYAPNHLVYVGIVERGTVQGKIFVKVQNGYELDELHNVAAQSPSNGQTIVYNSTTELWEKNYPSLTNALSSVPVVSGAGNNLTFTAGSGVTSGAGGSIILQPGAQATSGGDGKIIVKGLSGSTANLQEWQDSTGSVLATINSTGKVIIAQNLTGYSFSGYTNYGFGFSSGFGLALVHNNSQVCGTKTGEFFITSTSQLSFLSGTTGTTATDLVLIRDTANTLAQRRSTNAQTFRVYNTYTDASNYERLGITWASNICTIGLAQAGTGSVRSLVIAGANATSGAGGNVTITAGNGSGVGAGGNIILQPGAQGTSGGNGKITINTSAGVDTGFNFTNTYASYPTLEQARLYIRSGSNNNVIEFRADLGAMSSGPANSQFLFGGNNTNYVGIRENGNAGTLGVICGSNTAGGSLNFISSTTAIAANTNDLALSASAFQRLNCTSACSLTGIAPVTGTGSTHKDGRMIRVYNVGTANLTLAHNSASSTAANRIFSSTGADIILAPNDYVELIYDTTNNGSGSAGWRINAFPIKPINYTYTGTLTTPPIIILDTPTPAQTGSSVADYSGKWASTIIISSANQSLTSISFTDLQGMGGNFILSNMSSLTSLSFPALTTVGGNFIPNTMNALTSLNSPALTTVGGAFNPNSINALISLSFPALTTVGGNFQTTAMSSLTSLSFPALTTVGGNFTISNMSSLTSLTSFSFPALTTIGGFFQPGTMNALTSMNFPALTTVGSSFNPTSMSSLTSLSLPALTTVGGTFTPNSMAALTSLSALALTTVGGSFNPNFMASLTSLNFPALTTVGGVFGATTIPSLTSYSTPVIEQIGITLTSGSVINISSNTAALTTFQLPSTLKQVGNGGGNVVITSAALNQASVDSILVQLAALDGTNGTTLFSTRTVTITGTSSTPSATGLAAKATLVGRGCTVTTN